MITTLMALYGCLVDFDYYDYSRDFIRNQSECFKQRNKIQQNKKIIYKELKLSNDKKNFIIYKTPREPKNLLGCIL
jgi:hypothetical protein